MRLYTFFIVSMLCLLNLFLPYNAFCWQPMSVGMPQQNIQHVLVDDLKPNEIIVASEHDVYYTTSSGKKWQKLFTLGEDEVITFITRAHETSQTLFIGTLQTLYTYSLAKHSHTSIFSVEENPDNVTICSAAINPYDELEVMAITSNSLLMSSNQGKQWTSVAPELSQQKIIAAAYHPKYFWFILHYY